MALGDVLKEWLTHRREVLTRRSKFRLAAIDHRLEVLGGYLIAYLNIDKVIKIIRTEDEPKPVLMKTFKLSDVQAEAILNMRLRSLRRLEEFEIRTENDNLTKERKELAALLKSEEKQWDRIADEIKEVRKTFGPNTPLGRRRSDFDVAPSHDVEEIQEAMVEREPITVVVSEKGWLRAMKGHSIDVAKLEFKTGDRLQTAFPAETTDKVLVFSTKGRFYTLAGDKLPGGRGQGEPIRLLVDMDEGEDIVAAFVSKTDRKLLVASTIARGFVVAEAEVIANTRKGKQVLNLDVGEEAKVCVAVSGDQVAIVGENRKMLIFPLDQVPEMPRGKGVRLQKYKDGGLSDARTFSGKEGLTWEDSSGRTHQRSLSELKDWRGDRAQAGRLPPQGFPRSNKFGTPGLPG